MNDHPGVADRRRSAKHIWRTGMELASVSAPTSLAGCATAMPLIVSPDQFGAAGPGDFLAGEESREASASSDLEVIR